MNKPTQLDMIRHLSEHYGLPFTQVAAIMRVPTHPGDARDNFALFAMSFTFDLAHIEASAALAYQVADAMLAERIKSK